MRPEALAVIDEVGLFEVDQDGDYVAHHQWPRCVYATFDADGTANARSKRPGGRQVRLAKAHFLYPVRSKNSRLHGLERPPLAICDGARTCGAKANITVLDFCKTALIRRFGEAWYDEAQLIWKAWKAQQA